MEVAAEAPILQTDRTSVSGAVGAEMIEALPNITQNPLAYAFLQAGAVPRNATSDTQSTSSFGIGTDGRRQWSAVGVNGGRALTNEIQLGGLPVMGGGYNEGRSCNTEASGGAGHLQQFSARRTRPGRHRDEHEVRGNRFRGQASN